MSTPNIPSTMNAAYISTPGGVDALEYGQQPTPQIKEDELLIKVMSTSVNYIDVYHRTGLYKLPKYPAIIGRDGAGVVVQIGAKVNGTDDQNGQTFQLGQRVAFVSPPGGSYCEYVAINPNSVVALDNDIAYNDAVTMMIQGLTAHYLVTDTFPSGSKPGDTILIHAGAGGTGSIAIQVAKARGLKVITTVSSDEKVELVKKLGADHVINYTTATEPLSTTVRKLTDNIGVGMVLDGVGASTYMESIKSVRKRGCIVFFGNASGPVPPIDPLLLTSNGSIFITRPTLADYMRDGAELQDRFSDLSKWVKSGQLSFVKGPVFALDQIRDAHRAIEDRTRVGKIIIKVAEDDQQQ